jgi:hypothetical protein
VYAVTVSEKEEVPAAFTALSRIAIAEPTASPVRIAEVSPAATVLELQVVRSVLQSSW